jgi:hypothetical protein
MDVGITEAGGNILFSTSRVFRFTRGLEKFKAIQGNSSQFKVKILP